MDFAEVRITTVELQQLVLLLSVQYTSKLESYIIYCYKSTHFWDQIVMRTFTSEDWIENLRVNCETFLYLCDQLKPVIQRQDTPLRRSISVQHRLAITLWCLSTCAEYRTTGHLFGVARCTVCVIVHDTCAAIVAVLQSSYIKFPTANDLQYIIDGFYTKWGMVQCAGAIDGCHVPVQTSSIESHGLLQSKRLAFHYSTSCSGP